MDKPGIVLGTLNVKKIETNSVYVEKLLKKCDILFLQETWLFNFQLPLLGEYFSSHVSFGKSVDDENPLPPTQKPRGYGGVACFVNKNLGVKFKFRPNGGNRVIVLEVLSNPPLCIVGVYMPVRGTSKRTEFQEILDEISEIIEAFKTSHVVFVVGDMNSSLQERCGNERDTLLKKFVDGNSLSHGQSGVVTYIHSDGTCSSEIDYILYSEGGANLVSKVEVLQDHMNVSDHVPVTAMLRTEKVIGKEEDRMISIKPKWEKCNRFKYKEAISRNLGPFPEDLESEFDFLCAMGHLSSVLKRAAKESIPGHRDNIKIKASKIKIWNDKIEKAVKTSRRLWWEWKTSGSPKERNHPLNIKRTEA